MPCERIREQLTAYLDGDLEGDRGTVVRGHLRTCEACRQVAEDEAALRDGLRDLPSVDPPASMWAGVQARLASEEVAESKRPAWRRMFGRWADIVPAWRTFVATGLVGAAAITIIYWRTQRDPGVDESAIYMTPNPPPVFQPGTAPKPKHVKPPPADVTADLAAEPARTTASYAQTIDELTALAAEARLSWSEDRKLAFDTKVKTMRAAIAAADEGKLRQRASSSLIRYLEGAVIRDDVALAGGMP